MGFPGSRVPRLPKKVKAAGARWPSRVLLDLRLAGRPEGARQTFMGFSTSSLIRAPKDSARDAC